MLLLIGWAAKKLLYFLCIGFCPSQSSSEQNPTFGGDSETLVMKVIMFRLH